MSSSLVLPSSVYFDYSTFESRVSSSLSDLKRILLLGFDSSVPESPADLPHRYSDKWALAEYVTSLALASHWAALDRLCLRPPDMEPEAKQEMEEKKGKETAAGSGSGSASGTGTDTGGEGGKTGIGTGSTGHPQPQPQPPESVYSLLSRWHLSGGGSTVLLRLVHSESCALVDQKVRKVKDETEHVTKVLGLISIRSKTYHQETDYFWAHEAKWEWQLERVPRPQAGQPEPERERVTLGTRSAQQVLVTSVAAPPRPERSAERVEELDLSWLLAQSRPEGDGGGLAVRFSIDRSDRRCRTPRRNPSVDAALAYFAEAYRWARAAGLFFRSLDCFASEVKFGREKAERRLDWPTAEQPLFCPVEPVLWGRRERDEADQQQRQQQQPEGLRCPGCPVSLSAELFSADARAQALAQAEAAELERRGAEPSAQSQEPGSLSLARVTEALVSPAALPPASAALGLLGGQQRSLDGLLARVLEAFPAASSGLLLTRSEAHSSALCSHVCQVSQSLFAGLSLVEALLRRQLTQAVGRELNGADFAAYCAFHQRRLFRPQAQMRPLALAVRAGQQTPEGSFELEGRYSEGAEAFQPMLTFGRSVPASRAQPMQLGLSASISVDFRGSRHVHALVGHSFHPSNSSPFSLGSLEASALAPRPKALESSLQLQLSARARNFSCFLLLIGRVQSASQFDPKFGLIVQNGAEFTIPLNLELIPSAKEFKEAVSSISPEQQRFAAQFRAMQLESSMLGVLLVPVKPQLERLLRLPRLALTKEIRLTERLLELFIKYQIPSDLMTVKRKERQRPEGQQQQAGSELEAKDGEDEPDDPQRGALLKVLQSRLAGSSSSGLISGPIPAPSSAALEPWQAEVKEVEGYVAAMEQALDRMKGQQIKDKALEANYALGISDDTPSVSGSDAESEEHSDHDEWNDDGECEEAEAMTCSVDECCDDAALNRSSLLGAIRSGKQLMKSDQAQEKKKSVKIINFTHNVKEKAKKEAAPPARLRAKQEETRDRKSSPAGAKDKAPAAAKKQAIPQKPSQPKSGAKDSSAPPDPKPSASKPGGKPSEISASDPSTKSLVPDVPSEPDTTGAEPEPDADAEPDADEAEPEEVEVIDFPALPAALDAALSDLDPDGALRPTILHPGAVWQKRARPSLASSEPEVSSLAEADQVSERQRAFDLLDALSRSGSLPIEDCSFHVFMAATHCFERSLMDTLVQDSINPIEKIERSMIIVAQNTAGKTAEEIVNSTELKRIRQFNKQLLRE